MLCLHVFFDQEDNRIICLASRHIYSSCHVFHGVVSRFLLCRLCWCDVTTFNVIFTYRAMQLYASSRPADFTVCLYMSVWSRVTRVVQLHCQTHMTSHHTCKRSTSFQAPLRRKVFVLGFVE